MQGTGVGPSAQFNDFANIRATVVFPTPLTPEMPLPGKLLK